MYTNLYLPNKCINSMELRTALSRRQRKIPAINNPTAGLRLTHDLSNTKKTTQTLGCYVWPRGWVTQKLPKHWVVTSDPGAG